MAFLIEPDEIGGPGIEDSDPFVFEGTPWPQQQIRWFGHPARLTLRRKRAIQTALDTWAGLIPQTFPQTSTTSSAQFQVNFVTGDHGDGFPFDGSGRFSRTRSIRRMGAFISTTPRAGRSRTLAATPTCSQSHCTRPATHWGCGIQATKTP